MRACQLEFKGEYTGIREIRKHAAWYTSGYRNSSKLRGRINEVETYEQLEALFQEVAVYGMIRVPKGDRDLATGRKFNSGKVKRRKQKRHK